MSLLPIVCDEGVLPEYLLQRQRMVFFGLNYRIQGHFKPCTKRAGSFGECLKVALHSVVAPKKYI